MAQRRDQGFGTLLSQLAPLKWLVGISFVILIVAIVVLFFLDPSSTSGPKLFVLVDDEHLVKGKDFRVMRYAEDQLQTELPQEYAECLDANMKVISLVHVELTNVKKGFGKGFVIRFLRPDGDESPVSLRNRGLKVGFWSTTSKSWSPLTLPVHNGTEVIFEVPGHHAGFYAMGFFRKNDKSDEEKGDKTDPKEEANTTEKPADKKEGSSALIPGGNPNGVDGKATDPDSLEGLSLRVPVFVRGSRGLRKSEHISLYLYGLKDASPLQPTCHIGDQIVAEIRGDPSKEPILDGSMQLRWYLTQEDRDEDFPVRTNLLAANRWQFRAIPTHRRAEWLIIFEFIDRADARVIAEGQVPLSVVAP